MLSLAGCIGRHRLKLFRTLYIFLDIEVVVFQFRSIIIINSTTLIFVSSTFSILRPQGPARLLFLNFNQVSFQSNQFSCSNRGLKVQGICSNSVVRGEKQSAEVMFSFCLLLTHLESYQQPKVSSGLSQSKVQLFHSGVLGLQSANVLTKGIGWSLASFGKIYQL